VPNVGPDVAGFPVRFNHIEDLTRALEKEGRDIAAVMLEPVLGFGGCLPAQPGYLKSVHDLCKKHNVLLIVDEIQTGFGRAGSLMAYQFDGIKPDMVILGKSLTGGLYPMSLVLGSRSIMTQVRPGE
jgi:ornithine--oxo-acid transaminase